MSSVLRVAVYYPFIHQMGGVERTLVESIRRSQHDVTLYTHRFEPENTYPEFGEFDVRVLGRAALPTGSLAMLRGAQRLARHRFATGEHDVLLVHAANIADFALWRRPQIPTLGYCHSPLRAVFDDDYSRRLAADKRGLSRALLSIGAPIFAGIDRWLWRRYDRVLFNANETLERARKGGLTRSVGENVDVLHPGVDLARIQPSNVVGDYILVPGRITWTKGLDVALEAFARLRSNPGVNSPRRMIIAGHLHPKSRSTYEDLRRRADEIGGVEFRTDPTDEQLDRLYGRSALVLFPSWNEDFGLAPIEANAHGKAVVAVRSGGIVESQVDGRTGRLVDYDPDAMAAAIAELCADPGMLSRMGAQARANAERFDWDQFSLRLDQELVECAHGRVTARSPRPVVPRVAELSG